MIVFLVIVRTLADIFIRKTDWACISFNCNSFFKISLPYLFQAEKVAQLRPDKVIFEQAEKILKRGEKLKKARKAEVPITNL